MKYYDNPYQTERWNALKKIEREKNQVEQEIIIVMAEIGFA